MLFFQSELCSVIIPELEFTTALTTMPGKFTTLEGLLGDVASQVQLRPQGCKLFSCSTQMSMKFELLIRTKILTNKEVFCLKSLKCCIYHANKC